MARSCRAAIPALSSGPAGRMMTLWDKGLIEGGSEGAQPIASKSGREKRFQITDDAWEAMTWVFVS
jgi:hypothetical protein